MIAQGRRSDGQLELAVPGEEIYGFFGNFSIQRRLFFETGQQLAHGAWVKQRPGEAVLANFPSFLEDVNVLLTQRRVRVLSVMRVDQLGKTQRAGHPSRPAADDDH